MLDHADWRQLGALVATEPPARPALPKIEPTSASATRIRVVIDDLIHLILGPQLTTPTPMPALPTSPAALAFPAHQFLDLRASFRPPLRPRLRRIHRRRTRARARVLTRLLLQPPQPILVPLNPGRETENQLNTHHTPRLINRLRLGAIHACKIRYTNKESLPQTPTTERLRNKSHLQLLRKWSQPGSNRRPPACKVGAATAHTLPHGVSNRDSGRFRPVEPLTRCHCLPQPLAPYLLPDGVGIDTREHHNPTGYGRRRRHRQNSAGSGRCGTAGLDSTTAHGSRRVTLTTRSIDRSNETISPIPVASACATRYASAKSSRSSS